MDALPTPIENDSTEQSVASTAVIAPLYRSARISHPPIRLIEKITDLRGEGYKNCIFNCMIV